jgi:hypothetical protein
MGIMANGAISFEIQNANVRYWEAEKMMPRGPARSKGKEGQEWGCKRVFRICPRTKFKKEPPSGIFMTVL